LSAVILLCLPLAAQRWEYDAAVNRIIPDPDIHDTTSVTVQDSIFIPDHVIISDINFYVGIDAYFGAGDIDVAVFSPNMTRVYLSYYWTRQHRRYFFDIWFDTQDTVDGPGSLDDYVCLDSYGWWKMTCRDISPGDELFWDEWRIEVYGTQTGINDKHQDIPRDYFLNPAYPNPFNTSTLIEYGTPKMGRVKIQMFDILGRQIDTPVNGTIPAGYYGIKFDGTKLASGVYFCRLTTDDKTLTRQMTLIK
jgi:subtilisin-like proprotein convertase family protein